MLSAQAANIHALCEQCAVVMKQQQLSPSSFLARFFDAQTLSSHAVENLGKSGKGSAPVLAERIVAEWQKNKLPVVPAETNETGTDEASTRKRKSDTIDTGRPAATKTSLKKKKNKYVFEAWLSNDIQQRSIHKTGCC